MIRRWESQRGIDLVFQDTKAMFRARHGPAQKLTAELEDFAMWVALCNVVKTSQNAGAHPRQLHPEIRADFPDIEARIRNVTDEQRSFSKVWEAVQVFFFFFSFVSFSFLHVQVFFFFLFFSFVSFPSFTF